MNAEPDPQLENLFRAAATEAEAAASRAEFGFETRLLARLREERSASIFSWAWKLYPFFAAAALAAGIWSRAIHAHAEVDASLIAEATSQGDEQLLIAYMTGDEQ
jgi:hypothetical protein